MDAWSTFEIKAFDDEAWTFEGIASTPNTDHAEDVVNPLGAEFTLPIPLMWQHGKGEIKDPIGWVTHAAPNEKGIPCRGQIAKPKADYPQALKDELTGVWVKIRDKIIRGLSIGFKPLEAAPIKNSYGTHYKRWSWLELSPVGIPMNAEASIQTVKSYDQPPGAERDSRPTSVRLVQFPPMPGSTPSPSKGNAMSKTYSEQIKDLEATRAAKAGRMAELQRKAQEADRTKDASEKEEFDTCDGDIKGIDAELVDLRRMEALMAEQAKAVEPNLEQRHFFPPSVHVRKSRDEDDKFPGQSFTRMVIAKIVGRLEDRMPSAVANARWGQTNPTLVEILKVNEVAGGGTGTGEWGAELARSDARYTGDFIEFLYGMTVFDKLPLTEIPANVFVKGQDGEGTGYWVGESKAIPATALDFMDMELRHLKVAALAVISNELVRYSSPAAEMLVRNALAAAANKRVDTTFLSASAAVAGVSPAGILNGVTAIVPSGTDADAIRADIASLYAPFITAKNSTGLWFVTTPALAKSISLMMNPLGQPSFATVNGAGGSLLGDPVVVGDHVGAGDLILLSPKDIYKIGDTGIQVSISREAMIEQSSAPTGATDTPVAASQFFTSMFQEESTAVKIVRGINFAKRRTSAVAYIDVAAYAP